MLREEHNKFWKGVVKPNDFIHLKEIGYDSGTQIDYDCDMCVVKQEHTWEQHDTSIRKNRNLKYQKYRGKKTKNLPDTLVHKIREVKNLSTSEFNQIIAETIHRPDMTDDEREKCLSEYLEAKSWSKDDDDALFEYDEPRWRFIENTEHFILYNHIQTPNRFVIVWKDHKIAIEALGWKALAYFDQINGFSAGAYKKRLKPILEKLK